MFLDLLGHVVLVIAKFDLLKRELEFLHARRHGRVVQIRRDKALACDSGDDVVVERGHLLGMGHKRLGVGGHEIAICAHADHQRRTAPRRHQHAVFLGADHGDGIGAVDTA